MLFFATLIAHVPFLSEPLKLVGRHTLIILMFHMAFGRMARDILCFAFGYETCPAWIYWASSAIAVLLSLGISLFRDKVKTDIARKKAQRTAAAA